MQVPFLFGFTAIEKVASSVIHLIFRRTGRHLFLNDNDEGKPPLLKRMLDDCGELYFMYAPSFFYSFIMLSLALWYSLHNMSMKLYLFAGLHCRHSNAGWHTLMLVMIVSLLLLLLFACLIFRLILVLAKSSKWHYENTVFFGLTIFKI